jgi:hypothetical protein
VSVGVLAAGGESVFYLLVGAWPLSTAGLGVTATDRCVCSQNDLATRTATANSILEAPVDPRPPAVTWLTRLTAEFTAS